MYGVIKRMVAERHALLQSTIEAPRQLTQQCTQLVDSMGEAMRSFHSVVGMQSMALQAVQNQMALALVPQPAPTPPDYVGLGRTLLEIIRDLGMKAMDTRAGRRSLPASKGQEHTEHTDTTASEPDRPASSQVTAAPRASARSAATGAAEGAEALRRVLTRMGEVDVARAFAGPEHFADFLADLRKEMEAGRTEAASLPAPVRSSARNATGLVSATSAVAPSKTAQPPYRAPPSALSKTPQPVPSRTSQIAPARPGSTSSPVLHPLAHAKPYRENVSLP